MRDWDAVEMYRCFILNQVETTVTGVGKIGWIATTFLS